MPLATVETLPMVDGGEGFTEAIINITGGKMYEVQVTDLLEMRYNLILVF